MSYTADQLIVKVRETGIIPVFSHEAAETALAMLRACYRGGIRVFEFTNRVPGAIDVFRYLVSRKNEFPGLVLGAGTIMNSQQCHEYIRANADFIVAPIIDEQVAITCRKEGISWTPGCGTLTEIITAERMGAGLMKVFPAEVLGPEFIKAALGPCPWLKLMPTGGVIPQEENLQRWFSAGVTCVGMGSRLIPSKALQSGDFSEVEATTARIISWYQTFIRS